MNLDTAEAEMLRLSKLIDKGTSEMVAQVQRNAEAERNYRHGRAEAWALSSGEGMLEGERARVAVDPVASSLADAAPEDRARGLVGRPEAHAWAPLRVPDAVRAGGAHGIGRLQARLDHPRTPAPVGCGHRRKDVSREASRARKRADTHFSKVVRALGLCQNCGRTGDASDFQCAHILRRRYSRTRVVQDNAWCLCPPCHYRVDTDPSAFMFLVERTIGVDRYKELYELAHDDTAPKVDWPAEADFWREMAKRVAA